MLSERASPTTVDGAILFHQSRPRPKIHSEKTINGSKICRKSCHRCAAGIGMGCLLLILNLRFFLSLQAGYTGNTVHFTEFHQQILEPGRVAQQQSVGEIDPG